MKDIKIVRKRGTDSGGVACLSLENAEKYAVENKILDLEISDFIENSPMKENYIINSLSEINEAFKYECYRSIKLLMISRIIDPLVYKIIMDDFEKKFDNEPIDFQEDLCRYISYSLDSLD